ncbi:MAG: tRNA (adenosine(37)-N6)-threonylcarbamoyltransferase complex dimerization subunit type 1 TsaB [Candidatus Symbiodolus clandestinus]
MATQILALDCATESCSVALWLDGKIESRYQLAPQQQRNYLLPMVSQLLAEAGLTLNALDALAVTRGPGSFTGVRLGLGVVQGLAFGVDRPVISISTLEVLAQGAYRLTGATSVIAALDARLQQIYWGAYRRLEERWQLIAPEALLTAAQAADFLAHYRDSWAPVGSGWSLEPQLVSAISSSAVGEVMLHCPQAQDLLPLAAAAWERGEGVPAAQVAPCYLRHQVAFKPNLVK